MITPRPWYLFDRLVVGYCLLMILVIAIFGRPLGEYVDELIFYVIMAVVVTLIATFVDERRNRAWALLRLAYPVLGFIFFYTMTGGLMQLFFPTWLDYQVIAFERWLLGEELTLIVDRILPQPLITEIVMAGYFGYYPMLPGFFLPLFLLRHDEIMKRALTAVATMFFCSYFLFSLYPIQGPRWELVDLYQNQVDDGFFRSLVMWVQAEGAVRGGAMPSSHTGVALVMWVYLWRHFRTWAWATLPILVTLSIGTFWGRYHYVTDVVVGVLIAMLAIWITDRFYDRLSGRYKEEQAETATAAVAAKG